MVQPGCLECHSEAKANYGVLIAVKCLVCRTENCLIVQPGLSRECSSEGKQIIVGVHIAVKCLVSDVLCRK